MNAYDIVRMLELEGFRLSASGGSILINPSSKLTSGTRELLRNHKPEILALLRASPFSDPVRPSLESLVRSVGAAWAFAPEEVDEALTHALAKPGEARECFELLAGEVAGNICLPKGVGDHCGSECLPPPQPEMSRGRNSSHAISTALYEDDEGD